MTVYKKNTHQHLGRFIGATADGEGELSFDGSTADGICTFGGAGQVNVEAAATVSAGALKLGAGSSGFVQTDNISSGSSSGAITVGSGHCSTGTNTNSGNIVNMLGNSTGTGTSNCYWYGPKPGSSGSSTNLTLLNLMAHWTCDGNNKFKFMEPGTGTDNFQIELKGHGETSITTTDGASTAADLTFQADGDFRVIIADAEDARDFEVQMTGSTNEFFRLGGEVENFSRLRMFEMGGDSTADYFNIEVIEHGETKLSTVDAAAAAAHLELEADGNITLDAAGNIILEAAGNAVTVDTETFTIDGGSTGSMPSLDLTSASTAQFGSQIYLSRTSAGADSQDIGRIIFRGKNDAGSPEDIDYALVKAEVKDATDGTEEGMFTIQVGSHDGELQNGLVIESGDVEDEVDVTIANELTSSTTIAGNLYIAGGLIDVKGTADGPSKITLREDTDNGTSGVSISAPSSLASGRTITLPDATGTAALTSDIPTDVVSAGSHVHKQVKVVLSQANCNALNSTPIELIPAQGANTIIVPAGGIMMVDNNTSVNQTNSSADLNFHYADKEPGLYGTTVLFHIRRFMNANHSTDIVYSLGEMSGFEISQNLTDCVNKGVEVSVDSALTSNSMTSITIYLSYHVIDIS
tara:strand:- start:921 stop:2828 length:1908 start_codon:yes stop_codon:yes gene_type:complete